MCGNFKTAIHCVPHLHLYFPSSSAEDFITSLHQSLVFFIFKHHLYFLPSSPPLLIGAPVPFPLTAVLAIRSAVGLFKAWGTQGLDLLCHLRTSKTAINHTKATCTKNLQTQKHQNVPNLTRCVTRRTFCCTFDEVEWGFASNMHGLMWPANRPGQVQSVLPLWRSTFSYSIFDTHSGCPDGSAD